MENNEIENPLVPKYNKEVSDFFGLSLIGIDVYLIESRSEYDKLSKKKSEDWMVGFTKGNTVYILDSEKFETNSSHPRSDFEPVLKHEITHIYNHKLNSKNLACWLDEGTACYVAGQNKKTPKDAVTLNVLKEYHKHGGERVYGIGRYMVDQIIQHYGKEKLIELVRIDTPEELYKKLSVIFEWPVS